MMGLQLTCGLLLLVGGRFLFIPDWLIFIIGCSLVHRINFFNKARIN